MATMKMVVPALFFGGFVGLHSPACAEPPAPGATVLLITSERLAEAWGPFAEWKTRTGRATKVLTVKEIGDRYEGEDIQEKMRLAAVEHIEKQGTKWVILGGDSLPGGEGEVPDRDTPHVVMGRLRYDDIPSDVYFISETDWDANDDGVFGKWSDDREAISYGKGGASIGRIPVRTAEDVAAYTEKVIAYESRYPAESFAKRFVYTCAVPHAEPKLKTSWDQLLGPAWEGGEVLRYYTGETPWDGDAKGDHALSPDNWVEMINGKSYGKLHMHGHGFLPVWVLEGHKTVDKGHVGKLNNEDAYLTMTTVSCFTGHFDAEEDPCITESMLRQPKGGAVLVIAPAREGVPIFHDPRRDMRLMVTEGKMDGTTETLSRFWHHALKGGLTAGEAVQAARADMAEHAAKTSGYHWCQCELNLLGDPTLDLRAGDARLPKLDVPAEVTTGEAVTIAVRTDAPGATVCLWQRGGLYSVLEADGDGLVEAVLEVGVGEAISVTVCGPDLNVAQAEIAVR